MAGHQKQVSFGSILRDRRRQFELTQARVAEKVGCRANYIGYLESGARRPSQKLLLKLASALDLDAQELFLMANPVVRDVVAPQVETRESAWERFRTNKRLHTRHGITQAEIHVLKGVAMLGSVRTQRDFLFILQTIRQALKDD
jgi:transcriptional regulator with XRE-family HTH domain